MKYYKFRKIYQGKNPIIRVTFKTFWGKMVDRDICPTNVDGHWQFMDNGDLTYNFGPINTFYESDLEVYVLNTGLL
ncbi:MAG: hypothetical protein GY827_04445 [Cytophagales bacterium]|nr:hypothetical protein [Cytophagales bacterium]